MRQSREKERAAVQTSIIDHMGNAMQFQREIAADALKQTILLMGEQQKATAEVFASMRAEQEQAFARELQRRDSHTKETLTLMQSAVAQQGGLGQVKEVADLAVQLQAAFPSQKSTIGEVLDHSGDIKELAVGLFDSVSSVVKAAKGADRPKPPPAQLTAGDGANAAAAALARAGTVGQEPGSATPSSADPGNGEGVHQVDDNDDDGDPDWEVFLGWLSLARKLPPEQIIQLIQTHIDAGDLPVYLQSPLLALQRGDLDPLREVFKAADAEDVLERVIGVLQATAKANAPATEETPGADAGGTSQDVGPVEPVSGDGAAGSVPGTAVDGDA
jgi:hypothetical protein